LLFIASVYRKGLIPPCAPIQPLASSRRSRIGSGAKSVLKGDAVGDLL
jgi:hypothetical protein